LEKLAGGTKGLSFGGTDEADGGPVETTFGGTLADVVFGALFVPQPLVNKTNADSAAKPVVAIHMPAFFRANISLPSCFSVS
jgi:hypothetical protein